MVKHVFITIVMCLFLVYSVVGQQLSDTVQLSEVTVSSQKRQQRILDIPSSISTLNAKSVENYKVNDLRDASAIIPNFYMPEYGSKLTAPVYIRGVGSKVNNPTIGLYVDKVPYFEKSMFAFDFNDIEQVEVVRGPQGTLYGRNSLGGIVNISTSKPGKYLDTRFSADLGMYGKQMYRLFHNQPITDKVALLINLGYTERDGYVKNTFDNRSVGDNLVKLGSLKFRVTPLKKLILDYKISGEKSNEVGYPYGLLNSNGKVENVSYNHKSIYNRDILDNSLTALMTFKKFSITSVSSFQYLKDEQDVDQDFLLRDLTNVIQGTDQRLFSQEIVFTSQNLTGIEIVSGVFAFHQSTDRTINLRYGSDITKSNQTLDYDKFNDEKNSGLALFNQTTVKPLAFLEITAGLRFDYEKNSLDYQHYLYKSTGYSLNKAENFVSDFTQFSPKLAFRFLITPDVSVYTSISTGYRAGGFNTTYVDTSDEKYEPEALINYEIGAKASLFHGKLFLSATAFYIDWDNQQVSQRVAIGGYMYKNAGETFSKGLEGEMTLRPFKGLTIGANAGLTVAKYADFQPDKKIDSVNYKGNYLPLVPRYTFANYISYEKRFTSPLIKSVQLITSFQGIGKQYWNDDNSESQKPYSLVNASLSVGFPYLKLVFWGKNLLNTTYYPYRFYVSNFKNWYAQVGAPFTAGITLSVQLTSKNSQ